MFNEANPDWAGVAEALRINNVRPDHIVAATWCQLGHANIGALVDSPKLVLIHPEGIIATLGKRKLLGSGMKFDAIDFSQVRGFGSEDYTDERGFGKFCIEFAGPGSTLLGRLQWRWQGKRFRNNRHEIMAVAEERDRIEKTVNGFFSS